jgi:S-adenosyl-L-methionine hydrolase (adenosine-forming)
MTRAGIVTLTTDFGRDGPYVAAMKGIILGIAPGAQIVDVSHTIAPQNILEGAFVVADIMDAFPIGTVHLAVIDPGVGTDRRLVAVEVSGQWFVLPDNGLITGVLRRRTASRIFEITNPAVRRANVSPTFHGRDILAPASAYLARGSEPESLGVRLNKLVSLRNFEPMADGHGFVGEVIFRDAFGNLITNIAGDRLSPPHQNIWSFEIAGERVATIVGTYADAPTGSLVALVGSTGWVEIAEVNGDAGRHLSAGPGTTIWARKLSGINA